MTDSFPKCRDGARTEEHSVRPKVKARRSPLARLGRMTAIAGFVFHAREARAGDAVDPAGWFEQKMTGPQDGPDGFGVAVSVWGNRALVGAPYGAEGGAY